MDAKRIKRAEKRAYVRGLAVGLSKEYMTITGLGGLLQVGRRWLKEMVVQR